MSNDHDASSLFALYAETSLYVDDIYAEIAPLTVTTGVGGTASWVMFDAFDDTGRELLGNLYTRQSVADVEDIHDAALSQGRPLKITGVRSLSTVPGSRRFWVVGTIEVAPTTTLPSFAPEALRQLH